MDAELASNVAFTAAWNASTVCADTLKPSTLTWAPGELGDGRPPQDTCCLMKCAEGERGDGAADMPARGSGSPRNLVGYTQKGSSPFRRCVGQSCPMSEGTPGAPALFCSISHHTKRLWHRGSRPTPSSASPRVGQEISDTDQLLRPPADFGPSVFDAPLRRSPTRPSVASTRHDRRAGGGEEQKSAIAPRQRGWPITIPNMMVFYRS